MKSSLLKAINESVLSVSNAENLTPMHVLSLVASNAVAHSSPQVTTIACVLQSISSQPLVTMTPYATDSLITSQSNTLLGSRIESLQNTAPTPNVSSIDITNPSNVQMERIAVQLVNNPLTSYFYTLLTQKQLSPLLSSSSSSDSVCPHSNEGLATFSSLTSSVASPTDYLAAAAKMAAMAAMAGPNQDINQIQTVTPTNFGDSKPIYPKSQVPQNLLFDQLILQVCFLS